MKKNKIELSKLSFIISIIGFITGFILIGIVFDVIAIIFSVKAIKKKCSNIKLAYYAIIISIFGIIITSNLYSSANFDNQKTPKKEYVSEKKEALITKNEVSKTEPKDEIGTKNPDTKESPVNENIDKSVSETTENQNTQTQNTLEFNGVVYNILVVDGGDQSGNRNPNSAVDVGYGDRIYWGITNEFGQLTYVIADKIILQDDSSEPVNSDGRYYDNEANVPGTERKDLDQGHVIADSLGGVSNAYNITPQDSNLNRNGDQAYMEEVIRSAGGCKNFVATITYPDTNTQIPSSYKYEYTLKGNKIVDEFPNINPEQSQEKSQEQETNIVPESNANISQATDISAIDKNGNGIVTIGEAEDAGYSMPIHSDHWLYQYMVDGDGDGVVGE